MTETLERNATAPAAKRDMPALSPQPPKLMDQVRDRLRVLHYSLRTEQTYTYWIRWYIRHHGMRHPRDMGAAEVDFVRYEGSYVLVQGK